MKALLTIILLASLCLPLQADIVTFSVDEPLAVAVSKTIEWAKFKKKINISAENVATIKDSL